MIKSLSSQAVTRLQQAPRGCYRPFVAQRPRKQQPVCKCLSNGGVAKPAFPPNAGYGISEEEGDMPIGTPLQKGTLVARLIAAKEASGKTFSQIAAEVGLTNVYCTQLFYNQQQLQPNTAAALKAAVPDLEEEDFEAMMRAPMRSFEPNQMQEPSIYRLYEAIMHNGEAIKSLINEEFGDGIMSAIDFYCTVDRMEGTQGERRVVITFNGKFLPFVEQRIEDNVAHRHAKQ